MRVSGGLSSAGFREWLRWFILLFLAVVAALIYFVLSTSPQTNYLTVTIFAVGQGDAALIETPGGTQILIDGGPDNAVIRKLSKRLGFFDRSLDLVIGTHPDHDHIAGLNDVLARYRVATILTTEKTGKSAAAAAYLEALKGLDAEIIYARSGLVYQFDDGATLRILFPEQDPEPLESNAASIIAQLQYGEIGFMFTGDSPQNIENYLAESHGASLESEVLKLGHHGSDTSTSPLFLDTVEPEIAVASVGEDNRYGHPSPAVLERLKDRGIQTLDTASSGDITFYSDGRQVWFETDE